MRPEWEATCYLNAKAKIKTKKKKKQKNKKPALRHDHFLEDRCRGGTISALTDLDG